MSDSQRTWGGRFTEETDAFVSRLNASVAYDQRLYAEDIDGSKAHAEMLAKQGVITTSDLEAIKTGLETIRSEIESGQFEWKTELEDVHMNIESRLIELVGDPGAKLHTARSRNDQVATDLKLWLRRHITQLCRAIDRMQDALLSLCERDGDAILPGYTHLQRAQPILFGHHLLAYFEMFERDRSRFMDCFERADESPLGSAALAGTPFQLDREYTATALGFRRPMRNSLDGVADRDFAVEFSAAATLMMVHLSRLSEELVLWSSQEFSFVEIGDAFATGSSIMPQKKNPDIPELVRGKSGRVLGSFVSLITTLKSLPLAYNKDMQEDKEALFDAADTILDCVEATGRLLPALKVNSAAMRQACEAGFVTATDVADYLANKNMPFRNAHHVVGRLVGWCIAEQRSLMSLSLDEFKQFSDVFEADILDAVTVEASVRARSSAGGTAPARVNSALAVARATLSARISA
ncbi:MAG: argininosuccinate lyase [Bradymonadia bacterium]